MTLPPRKPATCAVCDQPGAHPAEGQRLPLCREHEQAWLQSTERARAATARDDFIRRARAERESPPKRIATSRSKATTEEEDDPWG